MRLLTNEIPLKALPQSVKAEAAQGGQRRNAVKSEVSPDRMNAGKMQKDGGSVWNPLYEPEQNPLHCAREKSTPSVKEPTMQELLSLYVQALRPILYIEDFDFYSVDNEIETLAKSCHAEIKEFSMGYGEIHFRKGNAKHGQYQDLLDFLECHESSGFGNNVFILLKDVHSLLDAQQGHYSADSQKVIARLRHIAEKNMYTDGYRATIFIVSGVRCIPKELEHLTTLVSVERPEQPAIEEMLKECASTMGFAPSDDIGELALELKGLSRLQIKQLLDLAYCDGGFISFEKDKDRIMDEKKQIIDKAGLLEFVKPDDSIEDVGGLGALCNWLEEKNEIFKKLDDALKMGLDTPRGVLILGVPGCGKSMTAKATASLFQKPLVRLDVGRLLGKYIGESESNMRNALKQAEAISPCVLWIDEIEKAFAGGSERGHEVTVRLIGQFLTWMQEKKSTVFVVATANNIETLPPEFLRKGRFDEVFSVDLPEWEERVEILKIHLRKANQSYKNLNLPACKDITEHFSGADIRSGVCSALEIAFIAGRNTITDADLQKALKETIPLYTAMQEEIKAMQQKLKKFNVKQAKGNRILKESHVEKENKLKNTFTKMERVKKSDLKSHDKTDNMNVEPIANLLIAEGISTALLLKKAMGMSSMLSSMPEHKKEHMELVDALKGILKM